MSAWYLIPERLAEAMDRWNATDPDYRTRELVIEWIKGPLCAAPSDAGVEDPDHPGIFDARVPGTNVVVTYALEAEPKRRIGVAFIADRS